MDYERGYIEKCGTITEITNIADRVITQDTFDKSWDDIRKDCLQALEKIKKLAK